jgi:ATP-dependent Lon protease
MFVCTANTMRMPQPLLDRMEVIRIPGYTEDEKVEIAKRHLIHKQLRENGLKKSEWSISDSALRDLIRYYTREAGVRNLEREIANLARKAVKEIAVEKDIVEVKLNARNLGKYAGVQKYRFGEAESKDLIGVVTGLAWTEVGGELLTVEAILIPGKGKMSVTGKLGDVMQESVQAANAFVRARAVSYGIAPPLFEKRDIHVHVPEGAVPKDGPSAGVAMITSMVSVLTGIPVRKDVAMTGEITLRGRVLPIGGLKEKLLAALRGGIKTVVIPRDNEKDLAEIPENVKKGLHIIPATTVDEVLHHALIRPLVPIEWSESESDSRPVATPEGQTTSSGVVTH